MNRFINCLRTTLLSTMLLFGAAHAQTDTFELQGIVASVHGNLLTLFSGERLLLSPTLASTLQGNRMQLDDGQFVALTGRIVNRGGDKLRMVTGIADNTPAALRPTGIPGQTPLRLRR